MGRMWLHEERGWRTPWSPLPGEVQSLDCSKASGRTNVSPKTPPNYLLEAENSCKETPSPRDGVHKHMTTALYSIQTQMHRVVLTYKLAIWCIFECSHCFHVWASSPQPSGITCTPTQQKSAPRLLIAAASNPEGKAVAIPHKYGGV